MKAALVIGMILTALGILILAYFASPIRFLMLAYVPQPVDVAIPITGGVSLACGIAVLLMCRSRET